MKIRKPKKEQPQPPPVEGDWVLFCAHAVVEDETIVALPGPFHWYEHRADDNTVLDSRTGEKLVARWMAICEPCHLRCRAKYDGDPVRLLRQHGRWIGAPPVIHQIN